MVYRKVVARGTIAALALMGAALALSGCGDTGPAGAAGAAGPAGGAGPAGAAGPAGPAGAGVNWVDVTGNSAQASPNTGYVADSSSQVTITLPADPALGDIIEVTGAGSGGWKIAQNAGQQIHVGFGNALWSPVGPSQAWQTIAASADGTLLAAAGANSAIYTSNNGGTSWTAQSSGSNDWVSLASSANGAQLLAAVSGGQLYISPDSGQTWTAEAPTLYWNSVAVSPDGTHMVASAYDQSTSQYLLYVSADAGGTWTQQSAGTYFYSFAWPTATELLGVAYNGTNEELYVSADDGLSWTVENTGGTPGWDQVVASADGTQLYVLGSEQLAISTDSGADWTLTGSVSWNKIFTSADGTTLIANAGVPVSISTDSGQDWTPVDSKGSTFAGFVVSVDDQKAIGIVNNGPIYAMSAVTSVGTPGAVSGAQDQSVTLQYSGNGTFLVISNEGLLTVQ